MKSKDGQKYEEKLLAKATVISDSANRLWRTSTGMLRYIRCTDGETEMQMQQELEDEE